MPTGEHNAKRNQTPEARLRISTRNKKNWQDPTYARKTRKMLARVRKRNANSGVLSLAGKNQMRKLWSDPEFRMAHSERSRERLLQENPGKTLKSRRAASKWMRRLVKKVDSPKLAAYARKYKHNGICKICGLSCLLQNDHDHKTGKERGKICTNCNLALGHFKDNTDTLSKAIAYLNKHKVLRFPRLEAA